MFAFYWEPSIDPVRLALGVISNVRVSHRHQFTGGVLRSMSGGAGAVDYDLRIFVGQERRS
jgi:hypothetical protein